MMKDYFLIPNYSFDIFQNNFIINTEFKFIQIITASPFRTINLKIFPNDSFKF